MNDVARAQLTFQMLTLLQKYIPSMYIASLNTELEYTKEVHL